MEIDQLDPQKKFVMQDIMRKRRKDKQAVQNKIRSKIQLKNKRKSKEDLVKAPQKFIKQYRAQQKSYSHYKLKNRLNAKLNNSQVKQSMGKLFLVIRIRGVTDISKQQRLVLGKLNLRYINTATFIQGTPQNIRLLKRVQNYITWGEPSKKLISQLIYKKLFGKMNNERIPIKSNEEVEKYIGGDIICLEDIVEEVFNLGSNFKSIMDFIFPFKLTTPEGTLVSRLRKPVDKNGHWGYRGQQINDYTQLMI